MSDLALVQSYRARAGRAAIRGLYGGRISDAATGVKAVLAARKRWRWLVGVMAEAGWPKAATPLHIKYLLNCPMFGVTAAPGADRPAASRACLRSLYCPFCYAREYAVNAYDRLAGLLPAGKGERVLCATEWSRRFDTADYPTFPAAYAAAAAEIGSPDRRAEVDAADPIGAVVFHRVRLGVFFNPVFGADQLTSLTVSRTAVMVCRRGRRLAVPGGVRLTLTDDPGRRELAAEVGRQFRYPVEWYAVPKEVAALGAYVARARVFSAFGACRRKTVPENDES